MYSAKRKNKAVVIVAYFVIALLLLWGVRHIDNMVAATTGHTMPLFTMIYALSFSLLLWQTLLYCLERPYKTNAAQQKELATHRIIANVPVCNEDAAALDDCITSMLEQTHPIDVIHVVVNGPNKVDYADLKQKVLAKSTERTTIYWDEQTIAGKRQAQKTTIMKYLHRSDFFLTVDSDAYLDSKAVEEGIKPFARKDIMSVAGIVLTMNNRATFMTRMSDLWFLVSQLVDRSANSTFGAVLVNSGVLAFYRGSIILDHVDGYTHETFFGRKVEFSDDSLLTIYALQHGKTVQQPTSFAFTLMPEKLSHHFRQQVRWMRGAFIRSMWRFKYLPMNGYAYWSHLIGWFQLLLSTVVFIYLFFWMPTIDHAILPWLLVIPILIGYAQGLRYLTVWRSDESFLYRFITYLCQPIPSLWSFFVLRWVRYYAIATCLKTGWGTRSMVEVSAVAKVANTDVVV